MTTLLAADFTWFHLLPGWGNLEAAVAPMFGRTLVENQPVSSILHLALTLLSTGIVVTLVMLTRSSWQQDGAQAYVPREGFSARNVIETILDTTLSLMTDVFGNEKDARRFLPLIGTLALFILFSNLLALVPGLAPPTDVLAVTVPPALVVFFVTHWMGVKENGWHYLEHFLGPKIFGLPLLAPLMLIIEGIGHLARPVSLSLRLFGNMMGDHQVLAIFMGLAAFPLLFPLPIIVLGTIVCLVQTLVFCLLSTIYIALAIEHSEEAH
jgi:F-type H+-transporting ATPase subunit a